MTDGKSSYLQYLPPVLWEGEPPPPAFSLGVMLQIFEKVLTGIDDGYVIQHGDHTHDDIQTVIDRIPRLFNPWYTPSEFLDWLAFWLSLELPSTGIWDDYQRRKAIAGIVQVYQQRGLKEGLNRYLDLYTVAEKRPRIAVDDGSLVLFAQPSKGRFAPIYTLLSQGPSIHYDASHNRVLSHEGLVRPLCVALAPDGSLFVGDNGTPSAWTPTIHPGIWRIVPPGLYDLAGVPAQPQRLGPQPPQTWNLVSPVALVVDTATPWNLYVLDNVPGVVAGATSIYQLTSPGFSTATPVATNTQLGVVWPVAMALDINGHLLVLDRGTTVPSGAAAAPKIIDVQIAPFNITSHNLTQVIEPLSLLVESNGDLIIGDAREQNAAVSADLLRIDRSNAAGWVSTRLLAALPASQNPLVTPNALVRLDDTHLLVLDLGLKPYSSGLDPSLSGNPFLRNIAEPAAVYAVSFESGTPGVTRATETMQLVFPTGMVLNQGTLYICDRGEYSDPNLAGELLRVWRTLPHEFGVVIHFSQQRPTTQQERRLISQNIRDIVEREKPAHTVATMAYAV